MEPQKESWEERFDAICNDYEEADFAFEEIAALQRHMVKMAHKLKELISQERLLAQKEFGKRLLEKKFISGFNGYNQEMCFVPVESIEAEIKELGV